jgi:hypothetical protein
MSLIARPTDRDASRPSENDPVARFAHGEISRKQAMRALGVTYSGLIDLTVARGLSLPRVSDDDAERAANKVVELLDAAR